MGSSKPTSKTRESSHEAQKNIPASPPQLLTSILKPLTHTVIIKPRARRLYKQNSGTCRFRILSPGHEVLSLDSPDLENVSISSDSSSHASAFHIPRCDLHTLHAQHTHEFHRTSCHKTYYCLRQNEFFIHQKLTSALVPRIVCTAPRCHKVCLNRSHKSDAKWCLHCHQSQSIFPNHFFTSPKSAFLLVKNLRQKNDSPLLELPLVENSVLISASRPHLVGLPRMMNMHPAMKHADLDTMCSNIGHGETNVWSSRGTNGNPLTDRDLPMDSGIFHLGLLYKTLLPVSSVTMDRLYPGLDLAQIECN